MDSTADSGFVGTEADSRVYLYSDEIRSGDHSACSYKSNNRPHCGKCLPETSLDAESQLLVVCYRLVFLLLVRRVLPSHLKRSVLQQQHSSIQRFMGIVNKHGRERFREMDATWAARVRLAFHKF